MPLASLSPGDVFLHGGRRLRFVSCLRVGPGGWVAVENLSNGATDTIPLAIGVTLPTQQEEEPSPLEELPSIEPVTVESLQAGFQEATQRPVKLRPLKPFEELVALQRKWAQVYKTEPPDDRETLEQVVPSSLTRVERQRFLRGAMEEAKVTFLRAINATWTKVAMEELCRKEGVTGALMVFNPQVRKGLEGAMRFKTDK